MGFVPGSGRPPGGGQGNLLQYSCLENPIDRGSWRATAHGVTKSRTRLKQLSMHSHIQIKRLCKVVEESLVINDYCINVYMYKACINEVIIKKNAERNRWFVVSHRRGSSHVHTYMSTYPCAQVYAYKTREKETWGLHHEVLSNLFTLSLPQSS